MPDAKDNLTTFIMSSAQFKWTAFKKNIYWIHETIRWKTRHQNVYFANTFTKTKYKNVCFYQSSICWWYCGHSNTICVKKRIFPANIYDWDPDYKHDLSLWNTVYIILKLYIQVVDTVHAILSQYFYMDPTVFTQRHEYTEGKTVVYK